MSVDFHVSELIIPFNIYLLYLQLNLTESKSLMTSLDFIRNPVYRCEKVYSLIQDLTKQMRLALEDPDMCGE